MDLHIGIRKDCEWVFNYQYEALKKITDYAKENGISTILSTGDFFDVRNSISQVTMHRVRTQIMPLFDGLHIIAIVGNHDMKHREKIQPNSLTEMLGFYGNVTIVEEATTLMPHGVPIDFIPWMCDENTAQTHEFIKNSKSKYCLGHFELSGYYFYKGLKSSGESADFLKKYERIYSGHYHTISSGGNVQYVGTPYTLTTGDADDVRGVWELSYDGKQLTHVFLENDVMNHVRLTFDADTFDATTAPNFAGKHVEITVINRQSSKQRMDTAILEELLIDNNVQSIKIIDTINYEDAGFSISDVDIDVKDNKTLVTEYIDALTIDESDKKMAKKLFNEMYIEAIKMKNEVIV